MTKTKLVPSTNGRCFDCKFYYGKKSVLAESVCGKGHECYGMKEKCDEFKPRES